MMVARHEMPGKRPGMIRPVGNGMIRGARSCLSCKTLERPWQPDHTVPYGTGSSVRRFQAFHAWLPSSGPYGTINLLPNVDANGRRRARNRNRNDY
jgi:hypothetical protein